MSDIWARVINNTNQFQQPKENKMSQNTMIKGGIIGALALILFIFSTTIVPTGHTGVKRLFGSVYEETLPEGFHIVNPLVRVTDITIQNQNSIC